MNEEGMNLEQELTLILGKVKIIMEKRKQRVDELNKEIEEIESSNAQLEEMVNQMLRDF